MDKNKVLSTRTRNNIATCIKERGTWGKMEAKHRMDHKSFDVIQTAQDISAASPKLKALLDNIKKLDKDDMKRDGTMYKHFIYCDVKSMFGPKLIGSVLLSAGYQHAYGLVKGKRGMKFELYDNLKNNNAFALLLSTTFFGKPLGITFRKSVQELFNSPENKHGKEIRIIVVDSSFREGIDLYDIRYVHVLDTIATKSDEKQAIGRATRFCGQKNLNFVENVGWKLHVYKYETTIPENIKNYITKHMPELSTTTSFFDIFLKYSNLDLKKLEFANELERVIVDSAFDKRYTDAINNYKSGGGDVDEEFRSIDKDQENKHYYWDKPKLENACVNNMSNSKRYSIVTLNPTQKYISEKFTPRYAKHGILLNHSIGVGKTCSSIATASSSFEKENYTIIYVTRYTLKKDVWKNMFGQICSAVVKEYIEKGHTMPDSLAARQKLISAKWFEPISYKQLSNMLDRKSQLYDKLVEFNGKKDILNKTLVIIDEAHKLFALDVVGQEKADVNVIRKAFQHSFQTSGVDAVKVLFMTATPYTSDPMDMMRLLNLIRDKTEKLPEKFDEFSSQYLDDTGKFTVSGEKEFRHQVKGYVSYLNREKDARAFAIPVFHNIHVPMSDYEYMTDLIDYNNAKLAYNNASHTYDEFSTYLKSNAIATVIRLRRELETNVTEIMRHYETCRKEGDNIRELRRKELIKEHKERILDCKGLIEVCKEGVKDSYEEMKKDLQDEAKEAKKGLSRKSEEYREITETLKHNLESLMAKKKFDLAECKVSSDMLQCIEDENELFDEELEKLDNDSQERYEQECHPLLEHADSEKARIKQEMIDTKEHIVNATKDDLLRMKEMEEFVKTKKKHVREKMESDKSQRTGLDKCLSYALPSLGKSMYNNDAIFEAEAFEEIIGDNKNKVYLISGHGKETVKDFKKRMVMPNDNILVIFPVCSKPNLMTTGCKVMDMFSDSSMKKYLKNPIKYHEKISNAVGEPIRIYLPGDRIPEFTTDLFMKFDKHGHTITLSKSGVYQLGHLPKIDHQILREPITAAEQLGTPNCKNVCGILSNKSNYTSQVHKEVYRGNIYKPAYKGTSYNQLAQRKISLTNIMSDIGNGIYYYIGCRATPGVIDDKQFHNVLEYSNKQQDSVLKNSKASKLIHDFDFSKSKSSS